MMMFDALAYHGQPIGAPWQFAQAGGFGSPPGLYGQGIGGGQGYSQLNVALAQLGLSPLVAACLAAQGAFASVLGQYGQQAIGGWPGHQQPGAQLLPFYGQQGLGGWPGQQGQQGMFGLLGQQGYQGMSGWPGQQQFGGGLGPFGPVGQFGLSPIIAGGFTPQSAFGGLGSGLSGPQGGAFGQRGPGSGIGSYLPFQSAPQTTYAG